MSGGWPDGGVWVVSATSGEVGWRLPVAVLAAASSVRVAAFVLGDCDRSDDRLLGQFATVPEPLSLNEAMGIVRTLASTHGLVLVVGVPGLLVPVNGAGWSVAELATAMSAPVVVATGLGADTTYHATLALGALDGRTGPSSRSPHPATAATSWSTSGRAVTDGSA